MSQPLFCYPKDRAKADHTPRDCESELKNDLRYLCFDSLLLGCGTTSSSIGNELQSLDNGLPSSRKEDLSWQT